jgi:hypothetical protein
MSPNLENWKGEVVFIPELRKIEWCRFERMDEMLVWDIEDLRCQLDA